jgi:outer membrane protein OmpA-like peptidoglycan-associated protein
VSIGYTFESGISGYDAKNFGTSHEVIVGFHFNTKSKKDDKKLKEMEGLAEKLKQNDTLNTYLTDEVKKLNEAYNKLKGENDLNLAQIKSLIALNKILEDVDEGDIIIIGKNGEKSVRKKEGDEEDGDIIILGPNGERKSIKKQDSNSYFSNMFKKIGEIYFDKNSSVLLNNSKSNLDAIVNKKKDYVLFVGGNASEEGTNDYNLWLADKRADRTMDYLINKGIPKERLMVLSYGERNATIKDDTKKTQDRKVDFYLYEK